MNTFFISADETLKTLAQSVFQYTGKQFKVSPSTTYQMNNYWDGGSKNSAVLIERQELKVHYPSSESTNPFKPTANKVFDIPAGTFILEHIISQGADRGINLVVRPDELDTNLLPEAVILSEEEAIVLKFTQNFKSSYNGDTQYRFTEANQSTEISWDSWEKAKASCMNRKMLNQSGAITQVGKNAIASRQKLNNLSS